jgi:hypothetical protein
MRSARCNRSGICPARALEETSRAAARGGLLMAYTTGALVKLQGAGSCNEVSFVESLQSAQLTQ